MMTKIKIQREMKNISKNLKTSMSLFLLAVGSILLALSCAPPAGVEDNSTPPGPATELLMEDADVDSTSFVVQWSEPSDTGTKSDGTALSPSEIVYRVYYLAGTAEQTEPDSESIQQNPNVLKKEVTGVTQTTITGLLPDTRYFVTVVSYNAFSQLETGSSEVFETNTRTSVVDFVGELRYEETNQFVMGLGGSIAPIGTLAISDIDNSGVQISYELIKGEGTEFISEPSIDDAGIITIDSIMDVGTSIYLVRASAMGYNTQEATLRITIVTTQFVGSLSYEDKEHQFTVGLADSITPLGTPSIPTTDSSGVQISYELIKGEGTTFIPEPSIAEDSGVISIDSITNAGTSTYLVQASAEGYPTEEVTVSIVVVAANFVGDLSYEDKEHQFAIGFGGSISPLSTPSIPATDSNSPQISYELVKGTGTTFDPEPSIDDAGIITIRPIANVSTSTYLVRAFAEGYNMQEITLTISIIVPDFVGDLAYKAVNNVIVDSDDSISPMSIPAIRSDDNRGTQISYELIKGEGTTFDPEPSIDEDSGIITINSITNAGTSTYTVRASAENYKMQEVTLSITTVVADFVGDLSYAETSYPFTVGVPDTITPLSTPSIPAIDNSGVQISYELIKGEGTVFVPAPSIDDAGIITIDSITNAGTSIYFARVSALGYPTEEVALTFVVAAADFVNTLSYAETSYPFTVGVADTITPDGTPSIPATDSNSPQISYELIKGEGDDVTVFVPEPSIDDAGIITIDSITNAGTSTYTVRALAEGYNVQEVALTIVVATADFVGALSYAETGFPFAVGVADTVTPDGTPSIPATDSNAPQISYELIKKEDDDATTFVPEPTIDEAGIISVDSITNVGISSYTVRASAMGYNTQEVVVTIVIAAADFVNTLSYAETSYPFAVGVADTITPDGTPSIPATNSNAPQISYELIKGEGDDVTVFTPEPTIDEAGIITIDSIANAGTSSYTVRVSAMGYNTQEVALSIVVTAADFVNTLSYAETSYPFAVGVADTITPDGTPSIPATDSNSPQISYELIKGEGDDVTTFTPEPTIDEAGIISINSITNAGTSPYTVRVSAIGYNAQEVALTIVVAKKDFTGLLSYEAQEHRFVLETADTITPDGTPSIPTTETNTVSIVYTLIKGEGTEGAPEPTVFTPEPTIDNAGVITINSITNIGTSPYTVRASAEGYNTQELSLTITITEKDLLGNLVYGKAAYQFEPDSVDTITPMNVPSIPTTETNSVSIVYSLVKGAGAENAPEPTVFTPEPSINEDSGVITINSITNAGSSPYVVRASATGYNTQEVPLTIAVNQKLQVSTYHSEASDTIPVEVGQAVYDNGAFSLEGDSEIIIIFTEDGLKAGEYTIHFGDAADSYNVGSYKKTISDGKVRILKSELAANSFSFVDGAVIGMSGPDYIEIQAIAIYRPLNIYKHQDLQAMRKALSKSYILKKDIVFTAPETGSNNYEVVGSSSSRFTGKLDGAGHSITGIQIDNSENYQGLFGVIETSGTNIVIVQNLTLKDFKIKGRIYLGALAGWMKRGTVNNVNVVVSNADAGWIKVRGTGTTDGSGSGGGLLGRAGTNGSGVRVKVQNTSSQIKVFGEGVGSSHIGGLIGNKEKDVQVTESHATGDVSGVNDFIGGLIGRNNGGSTSGHATGSVTGVANVGGFAGYSGGTTTGYATGSVTGTGDNVGGMLGKTAINTSTVGYATGSVTGTGDNVGGLIGYSAGTVKGYATGDVSGNNNVGGLAGRSLNSLVAGYATGSVVGADSVGGMVGFSSHTVKGFAAGSVTGTDNVGGMVGKATTNTQGYARGVVRRSSGTSLTFGKVIGDDTGTTTKIFSSKAESAIYDGEAGTVALADETGANGAELKIPSTTTQSVFSIFVFGTGSGQWVWVANGKWPAINIGDTVKPTSEQPIDACIFAESEEDCLTGSEVQVRTYYSGLMDTLPVDFGQATKDSGTFSLEGDAEIITIIGFMPGQYTIHFGSAVNNYTGSYQKTSSNGTISILKSDLATNSFSFVEGAVIGISGPSATVTKHIATYRPSNIYNYRDLQAIRKDLTKDYVLKRDIVFPSSTGTDTSNYESIGTGSDPFTGTLDGAGYTVEDVKIVSTGNYQGLFRFIEASSVDTVVAQNLVLKNFNIKGNAGIGTLAGWMKQGTLDDVSIVNDSIEGKVTVVGSITISGTKYGYGGGLIGRAGTDVSGTKVKIMNTNSTVSVSGTGSYSSQIGGLIGTLERDASLTGSHASGDVSGVSNFVGGLVGDNHGTISGYAIGSVSGGINVGGLVGGNYGTVSGYATGPVSGNTDVGGFVGKHELGDIKGYAVGNVAGNINVGGFMGSDSGSGPTSAGYSIGDVSGRQYVGGLVGKSNNINQIRGYARGRVRRTGGTELTFGKVLGYPRGIDEDPEDPSDPFGPPPRREGLYNSVDHSKIYANPTGTFVLTNTEGTNGSSISYEDLRDQRPNFAYFDETIWTLNDYNHWPSINIPDVQSGENQPVLHDLGR